MIQKEELENVTYADPVTQIVATVRDLEEFNQSTLRKCRMDEFRGISVCEGFLQSDPGGNRQTQSVYFDLSNGWTIEKAQEFLKKQEYLYFSKEGGTIDFSQLAFGTIKGMEIFSTGTWNDTDVTVEMLDDIVSAHNEIGDKIQPFVKLGHDKNQKLLQNDGFPAAGWITNVKRIGDKIVADAEDVPKKIVDLVKKKAYKRVSVELYPNFTAQPEETGGKSKIYPFVLSAVALLGGDTPAVTNLDDVLALYSKNSRDSIVFEKKEVSIPMDNEELKAQIAALTEQVNKFTASKEKEEILFSKEGEIAKREEELEAKTARFSKLEKIVEKLDDPDKLVEFINEADQKKKEFEASRAKADKIVEDARKSEIEAFTSSLVDGGKLSVFQKDMVEQLLYSTQVQPVELTFSIKQSDIGIKEKMTSEETLRAFLKSLPDTRIFAKHLSSEKVEHSHDEAHQVTLKYMKEHDIKDYGKAQLAVSRLKPELFKSEAK